MDPLLIAALIQQFAIPELLAWLKSRKDAGQTITDADIIAKLGADADQIIADADAWLASHPNV